MARRTSRQRRKGWSESGWWKEGRKEGRTNGWTDGRMERASVRDIRHLDQTVTDNTEDTQLDGKLSPARLPDKQPDLSSEGGA